MAAPSDWQAQAMKAVEKLRAEKPGEVLYGVALPETWKGDLRPFVVRGEVQKLLGVKRVTFTKNKTVTRLDEPTKAA